MNDVVEVCQALDAGKEIGEVCAKRKVYLQEDDSPNQRLLKTQIYSQIKAAGAEDLIWDQASSPESDSLQISLFPAIPADVFIVFDLADRDHLQKVGSEYRSTLKGSKKILVPGQWMARSLLRNKALELKPSDILVVGSPRIDFLRSLATEDRSTNEATSKRILYAPLHGNWFDKNGVPMTSSTAMQPYLEELGRHCELTVVEDQRNKLNKRPITRELLDADVVITDYTSVAYEAWALGKPVIFPRWLVGDAIIDKAPGSAEAEIYRRRLGYHADSFESLLCLISPSSELELSVEVTMFGADYLQNFAEGNSAATICKLIGHLSHDDAMANEKVSRKLIDEHLNAKKWSEAEAVISELLAIYPHDAELLDRLAHAYQGQHKWWQVVIALKKVTNIVTDKSELYYRLGVAEQRMGHFRSAAVAYANAIEINPGKAPADWFYRLGFAHASPCHEGPANEGAAEEAYKKACELDQKLKAGSFGVGVFHANVGRWSDVSEAFAATAKINRFDYELLFRLGRAQERCYQWEEAEQSYRAAAGLKLSSVDANFRLGIVLERQGKYAEAMEAYRYVLALGGRTKLECQFRLGQVLLTLDRHEEACNVFLALQSNVSQIDFAKNKYEAAVTNQRAANVEALLAANSADKAAWFEYYETQLQLGNLHEATVGLAQAVMYSEEAEVNELIALRSPLDKEFSALRMIEARIAHDCTSASTWLMYSEELEKVGQLSAAADAMQQAIWRTDGHHKDWYYRMGRLLGLSGDAAAACSALRSYHIIQRPHSAYEDKFLTDPSLAFHAGYREFIETLPLTENSVLYEVHNGTSMACNPLAIFEYILDREEYSGFNHFWVVNDLAAVDPKYKRRKNVFFVKRGSVLYLRLLATCKYLICNGTFAEYFIRKPGQLYLNTWHGTPLKTLGVSMNTPPYGRANTARNFLHATHMIFPNEHTRWTQIEGHSIDKVISAAQLISGYPRNDQLFNVDESSVSNIRTTLGLEEGKPVVLFAPTYRGSWNSPELEAEYLIEQLVSLVSEDYTLLFRGHHLVEKGLVELQLPVKLAPQSIDTNALLPVADVLISDYSSIIIDYMTLRRPVVHFIPDWDEYKNDRGLYFERDELPWPQCETIEELKKTLQRAIREPECYVNKPYLEFHEKFCGFEDGAATRRAVEFFFGEYQPVVRADERKLVLVRSALGTINGVASSAISLVHNLAENGHNVVLLLDSVELRKEEAGFAAIRELEKVANVVFRSGRSSMNLEQQWISDKFNSEGIFYSERMREIHRESSAQECYRILGDFKAHISVEHQGYHPFWAGIMSVVKADHHLIYLHNDMLEESEKRLPNLKKVFQLYSDYDAFLNVSESSMETNRHSFQKIKPGIIDHFHHVRNGLCVAKIHADADVQLDDEDFEGFKADSRYKIVNLARMWPEKNQFRLIDMTKILVDDGLDIAVYILGTGPLLGELRNYVAQLGLEAHVHMVGVKRNPYPYLKHAQCHVLSSDYEGQGIVLLEAMTLDVPCVSTRIPGPDNVLADDLGVLTPLTAQGLAEGVKSVMKGTFISRKFDAQAYNSQAFTEFLNTIH